jgi:hypothetical protein
MLAEGRAVDSLPNLVQKLGEVTCVSALCL